ncbi:MAG: radical SAM protein [Spirochaetales bacterium]|nr:radical SAM protein [Spirochaetales bacterium]
MIIETITLDECGKDYFFDPFSRKTIILPLDENRNAEQNVILGIAQIGSLFPEGRVKYETYDKEISGWYNEVSVSRRQGESRIEIELSVPLNNAKLCWWTEPGRGQVERFEIRTTSEDSYEKGIHWIVTLLCNFKCPYCDLGDVSTKSKRTDRIDIDGLMNSLRATGKLFSIGFTGGEPFMVENFNEACAAITKEHVISVNTNMSMSRRIRAFAGTIDPSRVKFILASFHIEELEQRAMVDEYIANYNYLKNAGFKMISQVVAYPGNFEKIITYRKLLADQGILLSPMPYNGQFNGKPYPQSYSDDDIKLMGWDERFPDDTYCQLGKECNAGYNILAVSPKGRVTLCHFIDLHLGDIYKGFSFTGTLTVCPQKKCFVPLNKMDFHLNNIARKADLPSPGKIPEELLRDSEINY